jgi:hypothetical protein
MNTNMHVPKLKILKKLIRKTAPKRSHNLPRNDSTCKMFVLGWIPKTPNTSIAANFPHVIKYFLSFLRFPRIFSFAGLSDPYSFPLEID